MSLTKFPNDVLVAGSLTVEGGVNIPAATIGDSQVTAASPLGVTKTAHQHLKGWRQPNTAATSEARQIHTARAAGVVDDFWAGSIAKAVGDSTVTVDLRKNGTTILSGVITLDSGNANYVAEAGTVSGSAYAAGDTFTVVITATAGTGTLPTGVFAEAVFNEAAST